MSASADAVAELQRRMAEAVAGEDYEAAARLRDEIAALEAGAPVGSNLRRQVPGRMGLGTDQTAHVPPKGWTRPEKPDPLVSDHRPRGGRNR
jgi:hypothetical protein